MIKGKEDLKHFDIGDGLGQYKIEKQGNARINGEKKYYIGEEVKVSGTPKEFKTKELLDKEMTIKVPRMIGLGQAINFGGFNTLGEFEYVEKTYNVDGKINTILPSELVEEVLG